MDSVATTTSLLLSRAPLTSPVTTISANQPTTSHLNLKSTLEIWAVLDVGVGVLAEAGEAVVVVVVVEAAEQHVGEDGLKR